MCEERKGFYEKYRVTRVDGSDKPGGKHSECEYFVLDLTHDVHAVAALEAYGISCKHDNPVLSKEILNKISIDRSGFLKP